MSRISRLDYIDEAGSAAIEFAITAPLLFLLIFGVFVAGELTATVNGLEQMSAGAARSTVAGVNDSERSSLAQAYIKSNAGAYPYIDASGLTLTTSSDATTKTFNVSLSYDLAKDQTISLLKTIVPVTPSVLTRKSVVTMGGV